MPAAAIELIVSAIFPLFETVTVCEELPPTDTFPKAIEFGAKTICGCPPVPLRAAVLGEAGSLLVTVREPEDDPVARGAYFT